MARLARTKNGRGVGVNPAHLRTLRQRKMWTQEDLSGYSGISQSMVASMEAGSRDASPHSLAKLCEALRDACSPEATSAIRDYLLSDGGRPPSLMS